jgi:hypothetical protein
MSSDSESSTMHVHRKGTGTSKTVEVPAIPSEFLGSGAFGSVTRIDIPRGAGEEPLHFAYKRLNVPRPERIDATYELHRKLLNLPHGREYIASTFRYTNEGYLMTDLSEGGKNVVMSTNDNTNEVIGEAKRIAEKNPNFIPGFVSRIDPLEGTPTSSEEFKNQAELIARELSDANISMEADATFFVIYPDGHYKLYVADFDNVKENAHLKKDELYKSNLDRINMLNPQIEMLWVAMFQELHANQIPKP